MGAYNWPGFFVVSAVVLVATAIATSRRFDAETRRIIMFATVLHLVGTVVRYWMIFELYGGRSDAPRYYHMGERYADLIYAGDFTFLLDERWGGRWWGTQFVYFVSGFVVAMVGPTIAGEALVFSMLSFVGLICIGLAFEQAYPPAAARTYQRYLWLWPSLWFWPSSVGKDALVLFGLGLVTLGYVGLRSRVRWGLLGFGLLVILCIRPHVAAMVGVGLAAAEYLGREGRWSGSRAFRIALLTAFGYIIVSMSLAQLGITDGDGEGQTFQEFVEVNSARSAQGGSEIETALGGGALALPLALVNVFFRPFLFEARNIGMMVSALETTLFWVVVWRRRRAVRGALRSWRTNRMLRLALPLSLIIALAFGVAFGNLGIIARQRIAVLPFLFVFLAASGLGGRRLASRPTVYSRIGRRRR